MYQEIQTMFALWRKLKPKGRGRMRVDGKRLELLLRKALAQTTFLQAKAKLLHLTLEERNKIMGDALGRIDAALTEMQNDLTAISDHIKQLKEGASAETEAALNSIADRLEAFGAKVDAVAKGEDTPVDPQIPGDEVPTDGGQP